MQLQELKRQPDPNQSQKLQQAYNQLNQLLAALSTRKLPDEVVSSINSEIDTINAASGSEKEIKSQLRKSQTRILRVIEKELKLVTKHHYRNLWMVLGMSAFGIPLGVAFGLSLGNMGLLGIGLPIGMAIGLAVGSGMDQKAQASGRQLDLDIKN
jgi:hypothetical protein